MAIEAARGRGTSLTITLPLPARSEREGCRLRVLLADDHSIVRRGLRSLLEDAGRRGRRRSGRRPRGGAAVRGALSPDVAHPRHRHAEAEWHRGRGAGQKLERPPGVIILSMHADESYIIRALAAGARAYLLKSATDEDLVPAVRAVAAGKPFFSPAVAAVLVEDYVRRLQQRGLTDSYRPAHRSRKRGAAAARRRPIEQGGGDRCSISGCPRSRRIAPT